MPSSIQTQIESSDDLLLFVKLHELDESPESLKMVCVKILDESGHTELHLRVETAVKEMRGYL